MVRMNPCAGGVAVERVQVYRMKVNAEMPELKVATRADQSERFIEELCGPWAGLKVKIVKFCAHKVDGC